MPRQIAAASALLVMLILIGCSLPIDILRPVERTAAPEMLHTAALTATATPRATPTETAGAPFTGSCGWAWANQDLPDLTKELNEVFGEAGLQNVEIRASAYGENCFDPQTNKVIRFAAMQTDFYLVVPVKDTADAQAMGDSISRIVKVLKPFLPGRVPGPNPGSIGIRFFSPAGEENLWFPRTAVENLLDSGKTGRELYEALHTPGQAQ